MRRFAFLLCLCVLAVFLAAAMTAATQVECACAACCDCGGECCEEGVVCPICEAIVKRRKMPCQQATAISVAQFSYVRLVCAVNAAAEPSLVLLNPVDANTRMNN